MYDQRIYRYYGRPKRYRDPRRSKMLDHRRRARSARHDKECAGVRRAWNRAVRKRLNQQLRASVSNGDYDVCLFEPKKTRGWMTW